MNKYIIIFISILGAEKKKKKEKENKKAGMGRGWARP